MSVLPEPGYAGYIYQVVLHNPVLGKMLKTKHKESAKNIRCVTWTHALRETWLTLNLIAATRLYKTGWKK